MAYPVFISRNTEVEQGCKAVNGKISRLIDSLQNDLKTRLDEYLQKAREMKEEPMIPFELDITDSVFMADAHYISVRFAVYTLTGGANGLTEYYAVNYSLQDRKFLNSEGILNMTGVPRLTNRFNGISRIRRIVFRKFPRWQM